MIHIDLMNNIANIKQPKTQHEFFVLESEMLYLIGSYLAALEEKENRELAPQEITQMLNVKLAFAKVFFKGINPQMQEELEEQNQKENV